MEIPYLNNRVYRSIEIFLLLFFNFVSIYHLNTRKKYKNFLSKIRIFSVFLFYAVCFIDNIIALINNNFPMNNFLLRGILIILLSKKLREEWTKIFYVSYHTRSIFFILFFFVLVFGLIGHQLFNTDDFNGIYRSIDSMFVLITTSNFPDIMLKNIEKSKSSILFFVGYLLITYFVVVSLLKALYYSNYLEIRKGIAKKFLYLLKFGDISFEVKKKLKIYLNHLAEMYSLQKDEIDIFKEIIGENNTEVNKFFIYLG